MGAFKKTNSSKSRNKDPKCRVSVTPGRAFFLSHKFGKSVTFSWRRTMLIRAFLSATHQQKHEVNRGGMAASHTEPRP